MFTNICFKGTQEELNKLRKILKGVSDFICMSFSMIVVNVNINQYKFQNFYFTFQVEKQLRNKQC